MPARRQIIPSYLHHSQSGRARAVWTDATGLRQFRLLPGAYNSPESRTAFACLQLELVSSPARAVGSPAAALSVAELLLAFLGHADRHYRHPDGTPTSEIHECRIVVRALRGLYADTPAVEFGPLALKAARQRWVQEGRSRTECNRRVGLVKRIFKWAVGEELVPPAVHQALAAVTGLQRGRTEAPETEPVRPVADAVVDATLPFLNRYVRGLVEFQRLTGCRPGEACGVRPSDLDTTGPVWVYRPAHHKNAWRGKPRTIAVGPRAQAVLAAFFTADATDHLFSPRRAIAERRGRAVSAPGPSRSGQRRPGKERYHSTTYARAVARACDRAFPPPGGLGQRAGESHAERMARLGEAERAALGAWQREHRWHPNQLRHAFATRVRAVHGLEAAQVLLGHARADVTQVYADRDERLAGQVIAQIG